MRIATLCLCLAWVFPTRPAAAQVPPPGERAVLHWVELTLAHGQLERALRGLTRALKRTPSEALALRYAELALPLEPATSARAAAQRKKSAALLRDVLGRASFGPGEAAHRLSFARAWADALCGDYEGSLALLERVGPYDGARALPVLRAIAALALPAAPDVTERSLRLARSLAPQDRVLLSELGLVLLQLGRAHEALPLLGERFAADPTQLSARRDYAFALASGGRPADAYALLRVALEACGAADLCLLELSRYALEAGQSGAALSHLGVLRERQGDSQPALFLEAEVHLARAEPALARSAYQRILRETPGNLRARSALEALDSALSARPSDAGATTPP